MAMRIRLPGCLRRAAFSSAVFSCGAVLLASLVLAPCAHAESIKLLTTGAFREVAIALAAKFHAKTGDTVEIDEGTAGALQKRVDGGEPFDVLVLTPVAIESYVKSGKLVDGSTATLAKVGIGVAVRAGSPVPEIRTVEQFRQALLDARAVAWVDPASGGSSGVYLEKLFKRMGIADQIAAKSSLAFGGLVAPRLLTGEADIALHQISEILLVPNVTLVGPIPEAIQNYTEYAGGVGTASMHRAASTAFMKLLSGPEAGDTMRLKGMIPAH